MIKPDKEFPKVDKMIHSLVWRAHRVSGFPIDELRQEACLMFVKCCSTYKREYRSRVKFSTWVYQKIWFHLQCVTRKKRPALISIDDVGEEALPLVNPEVALRNSVMSQIMDLSQEAQDLVKSLVSSARNSPEMRPRDVLRKTCEDLFFERGWDSAYTRIIIHEIQQSVEWK